MKRTAAVLAVFAAVSVLGFGCKGGGTEPDPDAPFSSEGPPGEPTELDWAKLGAEFSSIGINAIKESLPASSNGLTAQTSSSATFGAQTLGVPTTDVVLTIGFTCCGTSTSSSLTVGGTIGRGSVVPTTLNYSSSSPLQWKSGTNTWPLTLTSLSFTSSMTTQGNTIAPVQTFRLSGQLGYVINGQTRTAPISLDLQYQNFETGLPTANGTMGPVQVTSTPLPDTGGASTRCSVPREGCGPLVAGPCPCTRFPICPVYGITCGP